MPSTLGDVTRVVFLEEPEPGKIHLEFEAAADLKKGQQVKLNSTGQIVALAAGNAAYLGIGVLVMDVANGERATVACRGYAVIIATSGGALDPGPVAIGAYNTTADRPLYAAPAGEDDAEKTIVSVGWNLTDAGGAGEIKVLLN